MYSWEEGNDRELTHVNPHHVPTTSGGWHVRTMQQMAAETAAFNKALADQRAARKAEAERKYREAEERKRAELLAKATDKANRLTAEANAAIRVANELKGSGATQSPVTGVTINTVSPPAAPIHIPALAKVVCGTAAAIAGAGYARQFMPTDPLWVPAGAGMFAFFLGWAVPSIFVLLVIVTYQVVKALIVLTLTVGLLAFIGAVIFKVVQKTNNASPTSVTTRTQTPPPPNNPPRAQPVAK